MDSNLFFGAGLAEPPPPPPLGHPPDQQRPSNDDATQSANPSFRSLFGGSWFSPSSIGQDDTMSGALPSSSSAVTRQPTMSGALQDGSVARQPEEPQDEEDLGAEPREVSRASSPHVLGGEEGSKVLSGLGVPGEEGSERAIGGPSPDVSGTEIPGEMEDGQGAEEEAVDGQDEADIEPERAPSKVPGEGREEANARGDEELPDAPDESQDQNPSTPGPASTTPKVSRSVPPKAKTASAAQGSTTKRRRRTAADMLAAATREFIQGDYSDRSKRHASPRVAKPTTTPVKQTSDKGTKIATPKSTNQTPRPRGRPRKSEAAASATPKATTAKQAPRSAPSKVESSTTMTPGAKATSADAPATTPKRRGRPPKNAAQAAGTPVAKPKRGRPVRAATGGSPLKATRAGRPTATTKTTTKVMAKTENAPSGPPRKRGRPPKNAVATEKPKAGRGRPPTKVTGHTPASATAQRAGRKAKAVEHPAAADPPKRRGRPPKTTTTTTDTTAASKKRGRAADGDAAAPTETAPKRMRTGRQAAQSVATSAPVRRVGRPSTKSESAPEGVKEGAKAGAAPTAASRGGRGRAGKGEIAGSHDEKTRRTTKASAPAAKVQTGRVTKAKAGPNAPESATTRRSLRSRG